MKEQIFISIFYSIVFLCIFTSAEMVRKYFPKLKEVSRKTAHILCGLTTLSFPYFIQSHWVVLGLVTTFGILMLITKRKRLLNSIHDVGRKSYGSFYYPAAIYLIFLLANHRPAIYIISILTMTISDAFAALIGRKYGTIKYEVEGNTKSLEGSIIFLLVTFLCVHLPLLLMTDVAPANAVLIALIIAILLTGFEAISPNGSDNIIVPFGTYFLLMKMISLPLDLVIQDVYILLIVIAITAFLSMLKPTGLIGMMLINYAAITLGNIYWLIPLLLTEILFYFLIIFSSKKRREKYPIRVLFYMGIIPTSLIFLENAVKMNSLIFIPYLVSIAAQLPISYQLAKFKSSKYLYSILAILLVIAPSIIFYFNAFNLNAFFVTIFSVLIIYILNYLFHKLTHEIKTEKKEFRLRFASTAIGSILAFLIAYHQGIYYV